MQNKNLLLALCVVILAACSSSGVRKLEGETTESLASKIQIGQTRKADVLAMMGAPTRTTFTDSGLEVISYEFRHLTPRARNFIPYNVFSHVHDGQKKELTVLFDASGTVSKFVLNEADIQKRWGLAE